MARYALGTLAGALALLATSMASAAEPDLTVRAERDVRTAESFRIHVPYGDLELTGADGAASLRQRVRAAARDGCAGLYQDDPLAASLRMRNRCVGDSSRAALAQVDALVRVARSGEPSVTQVAVAFSR